jgi:hypothetical protein
MRRNEQPVSSGKDQNKRSHRMLKLISWAITVALAAAIGD